MPLCGQADEAQDSRGTHPFVLQGGIEHSEKLPPVEREFRHGAKLSVDEPVADNPRNNWYELPDWAAGKWTCLQSTKLYARDLRSNLEQTTPHTRSERMDFSWGFQQDRHGHVWEFAKEPYSLVVNSAEHKIMKRILKREFLKANQSEVILKTLTENVVVNKTTNRVIRTVQSESIQTCVPAQHLCMSCSVSYKLFDEQGRAIELGNEKNFSRRIASFQSIDEYDGRNMVELFREFLQSHGQADLLK